MTPQDFEIALHRTQLDETSKATRGARLVLLLGLGPAHAAKAVGCTRQAVNVAKRRILDSLDFCPTCGRARDAWNSDNKRAR